MAPIFGAIFLLLIEIGLGDKIPALQAPDEVNHLSRTLEIATGHFELQSHPENNRIQGLIYTDIHSLLPIANKCTATPCNTKIGPKAKLNQQSTQLDQRRLRNLISSNFVQGWNLRHPMLGYTGINYLPQAIAAKASLAIDLSALKAYKLARLAQEVTAATVFGYCLNSFLINDRWTGLTGSLVMTLPMMLFLCSSLSGDCLVIEGAILLAIQLEGHLLAPSNLYNESNRREKAKQSQDWGRILLIIISFAWLSSKATYLPLAITQAFGHATSSLMSPEKKKNKITAVFTILACASTTILTTSWLHYTSGTLQNLFRSRLPTETAALRGWDVTHAGPTFLSAIKTSFLQQGKDFLQQAIGILGSLDKPLTQPIYYPLITTIIGISLVLPLLISSQELNQRESNLDNLKFHQPIVALSKPSPVPPLAWAILLSFSILASVYLIFSAIWMTWSSPGLPFVEGVQGRYFLPLLPTIPLITALIRKSFNNATFDHLKEANRKSKRTPLDLKPSLALAGIALNISAYSQTINFWYQ